MIKQSLVAAVVLVVIYQFYSGNSKPIDELPPVAAKAQPKQANSAVSQRPSQSIVKKPKQEQLVTPQQQCISEAELINDKRQVVVQDWATETFGFGKVDYVNYLNESELLKLTDADNSRAMLILGLNYRWHARNENFQSAFVKPPELKTPDYQSRPYDQPMMHKSIYWLEQAATRGELGAFTELSIAYDYEIEYLRQQKPQDGEKIESLMIRSMAYTVLMDYLVPELASEDIADTAEILSNERRQKYYETLDELKTQWQANRVSLGLHETIELNIPPEYYELQTLNQRICEQ